MRHTGNDIDRFPPVTCNSSRVMPKIPFNAEFLWVLHNRFSSSLPLLAFILTIFQSRSRLLVLTKRNSTAENKIDNQSCSGYQNNRKGKSPDFLLAQTVSVADGGIYIQLFRQRLSHKRVKAYATMPIGIMGRKSLALID